MRVPRAFRAALAGLAAGYLASLIAAMWLRASTSDAQLVWKLVSPLKLASWILASAHAVPLVIRSAAGLTAPEAAGSVGRLSDVLGSEDVAFSFSVLLVPISILAITGITVALFVRWAGPSSPKQLLRWSGVVALTHGGALAIVAWIASVDLRFEGVVAPDVGLGAATGRLGFSLGHQPLVALGVGTALGAAFALAGGISSLSLRVTLAPVSRVVLLGWMRGLGTAAGIITVLLALGGLVALVTGKAPSFSLFAFGGYMLWANAVAAGVVLTHGVSMNVALDAGPLTGWERMDLLHFGVGGDAPVLLPLVALIPIAAGVVAGRFIRSRTEISNAAIALRFGMLWGLTLALLSLLLRVHVLSSFSVGALDLGGGGAAFDPLIALVLGAVWGTATSYVGARFIPARAITKTADVSGTEDDSSLWACTRCQMPNTSEDEFCVSCGLPRSSADAPNPP
ncbi:MAG: hypothetical protein WD646_12400 [Actinomycetota bacterium]